VLKKDLEVCVSENIKTDFSCDAARVFQPFLDESLYEGAQWQLFKTFQAFLTNLGI